MSNINVVKTIELVEVSKIKPYKNNARVNDHVVPALIKSIERFGFNQPVVLDKNYEIVCGHTRIKAAIALKMKEVPCVFANDLTQDEINAYRLADNKVAEQALWDYEKLNVELEKLGNTIAMIDFGFSKEEEENIACKGPTEVEVNLNTFRIIVECDDEDDAQNKFNAIREMGFKCSLSTL